MRLVTANELGKAAFERVNPLKKTKEKLRDNIKYTDDFVVQ